MGRRSFYDSPQRMLREAKDVYVPVNGPDDVFYAKVSKAEALRLIEGSGGQLVLTFNGPDVYIERRER
jgi:hypothetical protein